MVDSRSGRGLPTGSGQANTRSTISDTSRERPGSTGSVPVQRHEVLPFRVVAPPQIESGHQPGGNLRIVRVDPENCAVMN
ncbi:MAG: hypothetical protein CM1200mP20_16830 [Pseudomonadota bacterium]|nr:MAG: hypothetical protein CM1200mP20_16830 [Pseudomonadota bacterium]